MAKFAMVVMLVTLMALAADMPWVQGLGNGLKNQEVNWAKTLVSTHKETVTKLQFYYHERLGGKTPTAVRIAQASGTEKSPTFFGSLLMADIPLTEGPEPTSKLVGRAQGLYGSAGQTEFSVIMALTYGFIDGIYNGSSFSIIGRNQIMNPVREMPIVGGSGVFRMARGYAFVKNLVLNITTGAIVGYNVILYH